MAEGLVLTRRVSERGVHETAQRGGESAAAELVRHYVGYEEWPESGFVRRELARRGVALILGFGDPIDVYANGNDNDREESTPQSLGAFVVGNQSGSSLTGIGGHQLGVQVELTPAGALALFRGEVSHLNDAALPLDEVLGERGRRLVERLADSSTWADRFDILDHELAAPGSSCGYSECVPALPPEVTWLRRQLEASQGRARVEPLMDETGWSRRHMTERFRSVLGVPPKAYAAAVPLRARLLPARRPARWLGQLTHAGRRRRRCRLLRPVAPDPRLRRAGGHDAEGLPGRCLVRARGQFCPRRPRARSVTVRT